MFLALDLGNTTTKAALFTSGQPDPVRTHRLGAEADLAAELGAWVGSDPLTGSGFASVAPGRSDAARQALADLAGARPYEISPGHPLPFRMAYATPETLGADRLAAAAGGLARLDRPEPLIVVDAGTAVTLEVVTAEPAYLGGAIAPGPELLARSLADGTAQLPPIPLELPGSPVGASTREAIQSGVLWGFVGAVAGLIAQGEASLGARARVFATGGWGDWLAGHLDRIDAVYPHLVLEGVRALAEAG